MDGNLNTRWSTFGEGEWLLFDMGKEKTVTSVDMAFFKGNERQGHFSIELSMDGENFNSVYSGSSSGTTLDLENYDFVDQSARFVRIIGMGNSSNEWNSITEVKINTEIATTIVSENYSEGWNLYPNPYRSGVLTINTPFSEMLACNLLIVDMGGKEVYKKSDFPANNGVITLADLDLIKGMYHLQIKNKQSTKVLPFVVTM
ncbi:discoidin domain-containing protein [Carboxylicivirga linearis]|uniref:Discoidin domain-containing protein n=2 Tax=Carboxylicivirga linearis TaxID=1628157 RepID=A0ABS5JYB0_9BACT|nr:discoidin domain-containing protein [Carboxylicivirga linearis]